MGLTFLVVFLLLINDSFVNLYISISYLKNDISLLFNTRKIASSDKDRMKGNI